MLKNKGKIAVKSHRHKYPAYFKKKFHGGCLMTATFDEMIDTYKKTRAVLNSEYALPWCAYYALWYCNPPEKFYNLVDSGNGDCIAEMMRIGAENGAPMLSCWEEEHAFELVIPFIFNR